MKSVGLLLAAAAVAFVSAQGNPDEITSLPGFNQPFPSKQYSGFLDAGNSQHLHYWLVESEVDPANDPVVVWLNGGPGCSSLGGFWHEQGPFRIANGAGDTQELVLRPTRWNARGLNMVFLESPAGVGFSYATTPYPVKINDTGTAIGNYNGLVSFFGKYPQWLSNDFYITGESYAGVYAPMFAQQIVLNNKAGAPTQINLKGIMVNDGCTGTDIGVCGSQANELSSQFFSNMAMYSEDLRAKMLAACEKDWVNPSAECEGTLMEMYAQIGSFDIYNVDDSCGAPPGAGSGGSAVVGDIAAFHSENEKRKLEGRPAYWTEEGNVAGVRGWWKRPPSTIEKKVFATSEARQNRQLFGYDDTNELELYPAGITPCMSLGGPAVGSGKYMNTPEVRKAIHVENATQYNEAWSTCVGPPQLDYSPSIQNELKEVYPDLLGNIKIIIGVGATDGCVPYTDNELWTYDFASTQSLAVKTSWSPWYYQSPFTHNLQLGGYVTEWSSDFTFVTIRDSGHMVPTFQPHKELSVLDVLINGTAWINN